MLLHIEYIGTYDFRIWNILICIIFYNSSRKKTFESEQLQFKYTLYDVGIHNYLFLIVSQRNWPKEGTSCYITR